MNILILNGSPRPNGNTAAMIRAFVQGARSAGHHCDTVDVCRKNIHGCLACEYCHNKGNGSCVQKDDMQEVYGLLKETDMLVLASPIYYHNMSGQLKCAIDRFYAVCTPEKPERLRKVSMLLSSGDPDMYEGALFSYKGDFLDYLKLEDCGVFTVHDEVTEEQLNAIREHAEKL